MDRHTHTDSRQTDMTNIHFALSTTHAKCNNIMNEARNVALKYKSKIKNFPFSDIFSD